MKIKSPSPSPNAGIHRGSLKKPNVSMSEALKNAPRLMGFSRELMDQSALCSITLASSMRMVISPLNPFS